MIKQLPKVLSWRGGIDSSQKIYNSYFNYLKYAFEIWLSHVHELDTALAGSLKWQFESLPQKSSYRFLVAPETYRRLVYGSGNSLHDHVDFVSESFCTERCLIRQEHFLTRPMWTAMGDYYLPQGHIGVVTESNIQEWEWRSNVVFSAPRIGNQIVVDYVSPRSKVALDLGPSEDITHSPQELELIHHRLEKSLIGIRGVCPNTFDIINLIVKVITVKRDLVEANGLSSSSWSSNIGRVLLTNAHLSDISLAQLANALIHEATHSLIYMLELMCPFYFDKASVSEFTIKSPWTGRTLFLSSYLHACFVWFGLWCFWHLALNSSAFARDEIDQHLTKSTQGFLQGSLITPILEIKGKLMPELLEAVQMAQESVVANEAR